MTAPAPAPAARFADRVVFVTGGAKPAGMGFAAARAFLAEGARVFLYDLDGDALDVGTDRLAEPDRVAARVGDVRAAGEVAAAMDDCEARLGPIDVVLNHAGIGPSQHTLAIELDEWRRVLGTNLHGAFTVGQAAARRMAACGRGVILNMGSTGGIATEPGHSHYGASKAGILGLTRWMAADLAGSGVRVNAVCPGDVDTYAWGNVELARLYRMRIAAGRSGTPDEVAAVYMHLASDAAAHVSGAAFVVDGGMLAWE